MSQFQRDKVMSGFRNGTVEILIATDVAARGIDVDDVEAVFNYDVPQDIEYYVHRIGRTGRAGRTGRSFTLVVGREIYKIREIENVCHTKIKARTIPSAADITAVKAQKILSKVMDVRNEKDLTKMTKIITDKMNDDDVTAIELVAAFLKLHMGEELEDIPVERRSQCEKSAKDERRKQELIGRDGNARNEKGKVDFGVERRLREKREKQKNKKNQQE